MSWIGRSCCLGCNRRPSSASVTLRCCSILFRHEPRAGRDICLVGHGYGCWNGNFPTPSFSTRSSRGTAQPKAQLGLSLNGTSKCFMPHITTGHRARGDHDWHALWTAQEHTVAARHRGKIINPTKQPRSSVADDRGWLKWPNFWHRPNRQQSPPSRHSS